MTLKVVSRQQYARDAGLTGDDGTVAARGVADLFRQALFRWGLSPRRSLLQFAREQLEAADLEGGVEVGSVLDRLQALGECQAVSVAGKAYVAPGEPVGYPPGRGLVPS